MSRSSSGSLDKAPLVPRRRSFGLGLRAQILAVMVAVFAASLPLLSAAAFRLTAQAERTQELARTREHMARLADLSGSADGLSLVRTLSERWCDESASVRGIAFTADTGSFEVGERVRDRAPEIEVTAASGQFRLWMSTATAAEVSPLSRMLTLYVGVTAAAILIVVYVAMTFLIVRPITRLRRASERLADGKEYDVPVHGGAELADLSSSFNHMARKLRAEQQALEQRYAELERTTEALRSAQDQVARSAQLASVGRLAAGVAHEIGNPLAAISGLLEILEDDADDASAALSSNERSEFLKRAQSETVRIQSIIRELLDFARGGGGEETAETIGLREIVERAVHLVQPQRGLREVTILRDYAEEANVHVPVERIVQVVVNLLLNAADAMDGKGEIRIHSRVEGDEVRLHIEDTGPGVSSDVVETLFEPFVTTKPAGKGTGLGLAVSRTLIERCGGWLRLGDAEQEDEAGGACFSLGLPRA